MAILKILAFPNPILRKKSKAVAKITPEIKRLIKVMFKTMYAAPGVGLAAPQIGKNIKLIVLDIKQSPMVLINPKIIKKSGKQIFVEGCLSLPGIEGPVERASYVEVKSLDREGNPVTYIAKGFLATVLQHEIDHLEGKVFIDRIKDSSQIKTVSFEDKAKEERL